MITLFFMLGYAELNPLCQVNHAPEVLEERYIETVMGTVRSNFVTPRHHNEFFLMIKKRLEERHKTNPPHSVHPHVDVATSARHFSQNWFHGLRKDLTKWPQSGPKVSYVSEGWKTLFTSQRIQIDASEDEGYARVKICDHELELSLSSILKSSAEPTVCSTMDLNTHVRRQDSPKLPNVGQFVEDQLNGCDNTNPASITAQVMGEIRRKNDGLLEAVERHNLDRAALQGD